MTRTSDTPAPGGDEIPRRILFICGADFRGPSEKVVLGYSLGLLLRGHTVAVAVRGDVDSLKDELDGPHPSGLSVFSYGFRARRMRSSDLRLAREFEPDVVHAYHPRLPVMLAARQIAGGEIPIVVNFEDDEWGLAAGAKDDSRMRRTARYAARLMGEIYPPRWSYATPASFRWVAREAAGLHAITPELAKHVQSKLERECDVLLPVHPGLSSSVQPRPPELPAQVKGRQVVVFTGAVFGPHAADFRLLLAAMGVLARRGKPVPLVFAGSVAPRFDVGAWARESGIADGDFVELGYLPGDEMRGLLEDATVLVQPGAPTEFNRLRLPSKLQTYLASGTPTVTFACGAGELFRDREEVLKTEGSTPDELADRIGEVLDAENLRATLALNGPKAAERLFDRDRNTETLLGIYQRALQSGPASTGTAGGHLNR